MLTLGNVPDVPYEQYFDGGKEDEQSIAFIQWPARVGNERVDVRISTRELSDYDCEDFGIDSAKIKAALTRHRDCIQDCARSRFRSGDSVVTLDVGSLRVPQRATFDP